MSTEKSITERIRRMDGAHSNDTTMDEKLHSTRNLTPDKRAPLLNEGAVRVPGLVYYVPYADSLLLGWHVTQLPRLGSSGQFAVDQENLPGEQVYLKVKELPAELLDPTTKNPLHHNLNLALSRTRWTSSRLGTPASRRLHRQCSAWRCPT